MAKRPCCNKEAVVRGAWSASEDRILTNYIKCHGIGKWREIPERAGLMRCFKSCRLRWLNYLRPDIKRGNISLDEEELIIRLHKLLGNRWSLIAGRLPGRTDNEIKNYWNTILSKKAPPIRTNPKTKKILNNMPKTEPTKKEPLVMPEPHPVIRTKALRCTKVFFPARGDQTPKNNAQLMTCESSPSSTQYNDSSFMFLTDFEKDGHFTWDVNFEINGPLLSNILNSNFMEEPSNAIGGCDEPIISNILCCNFMQENSNAAAIGGDNGGKTVSAFSEDSVWDDVTILKD